MAFRSYRRARAWTFCCRCIFLREGDWEKMVDASEMGTVFCWEIRGPRRWSSEMRESCTYISSIIWSCTCEETDEGKSDDRDVPFQSNYSRSPLQRPSIYRHPRIALKKGSKKYVRVCNLKWNSPVNAISCSRHPPTSETMQMHR